MNAAVALLIVVCVLLAVGCVSSPGLSSNAQIIPEDKYIFFEHYINSDGVTVTGECNPRMLIDFPLYFFDRKSRVLTVTTFGEKPVNESLLLFYGSGESLSGVEGGGTRSWAGPVYKLPLSINGNNGNVTLDSITADGTVFFHYNDKQLSLKPDESWENTTRV